jgi:hypothetical protein
MYLQIQVKLTNIYLDERRHMIPPRYQLSYRVFEKILSSLYMVFNISSQVRNESCGVGRRSPFAKTKTHFKVYGTIFISILFLAVRNFWSRTKEGLSLRMFLRKWQEMKKLFFHGRFHDLFYSPNITCVINPRGTGWARHFTRVGEEIYGRNIFVEQPERMLLLGRPRYRGE